MCFRRHSFGRYASARKLPLLSLTSSPRPPSTSARDVAQDPPDRVPRRGCRRLPGCAAELSGPARDSRLGRAAPRLDEFDLEGGAQGFNHGGLRGLGLGARDPRCPQRCALARQVADGDLVHAQGGGLPLRARPRGVPGQPLEQLHQDALVAVPRGQEERREGTRGDEQGQHDPCFHELYVVLVCLHGFAVTAVVVDVVVDAVAVVGVVVGIVVALAIYMFGLMDFIMGPTGAVACLRIFMCACLIMCL